MTARTFEDSTGAVWEVFEVHRAPRTTLTVSAGLEGGWLAFVSGESKRRLAPFPASWASVDDAELERLCRQARVRRSSGAAAAEPSLALAAGASPVASPGTSADPVEATVREFARQARTRRLAAIDAMVELKAMLARVHPGAESVARDLRSVRRWFVESYYFDRGGSRPPNDQSR